MKTKNLIEFHNKNSPEKVKAYLDQVLENLKETSKIVYRYFIYLVIILFVYYLLEESVLKNISIGVTEISDLRVIKIFTPPIFAVVYLVVFIGEYRREDLMHQAKVLFNLINVTQLNADDLDRHHLNDFNVSYLPFYLPTELTHKLSTQGCLNVLLILILVVFYFVLGVGLYAFQYHIMTELYAMWSENLLIKFTFVITCTAVFLSFVFFFKIVFRKQAETKEDKDFWLEIAREQGASSTEK